MPQIDIKNIIQIIPNMEIGGAEKTVLEIGAYLKNTHYEPIVLTSGGGMIENLKEKKIKVLTRKIDQKNPYTIFTNIEKFKNIFLENKISLVHARSRAPAWSAYYASKKLNIPFITTWHGHAENSSFFKKKYNSIMLKGNAVIANSEYTAKKISENYSYDISNIDIIPRGVSSSDYTSNNFSEKEIIDLKRKWIIKDDQKVILLPARYSRWKGHELAIRACSKIVEENPKLNISIIFIGNKEGNEKYVSNLEKLSNTLGLSNYIKILGNFENMPLAYHISDIILYPSIIPEPFGRVPIEAQAAGKIIIASNNGGMTETIKEGEDNTGFRIKNNDVEDLKNKINLSLNLNDDEISNLRKRAIEYVDKNFSLENMCKKTLDVYDRILNVSKK